MSDSVEFMNAYNDVVFENLTAILKQNFIFQTQLKIVDTQIKKVADLEKVVASQSQQQTIIDTLTRELNEKREEVRRSTQVDADRHRIQTALNEKSQEVTSLRAQIDVLNREVSRITPLQDELTVVKTELAQKAERLEQFESPVKQKGRKKSTAKTSEETPLVASRSTSDSDAMPLNFTTSPGGFF